MLLIFLRVLYACVCIGGIGTYVTDTSRQGLINEHPFVAFCVLLAFSQIVTIVDWLIPRKRIDVISSFYFGLLIGVLLSRLMLQALEPALVNSPYRTTMELIVHLVLPYICISLLMQTRDDFRFVIPYVEFARELKGGRPLVVDSSSLIDGRISDVVETQILESRLVVPDFVLKEVQDIADSNDKGRRTRGRRGLEVLSKLQNSANVEITVQDTQYSDYKGMTVDQRIVALAKTIAGGVITNDFNLNKVASVQGIPVINLNDVANALKPRFIPGERLRIKVIKEGESQGQGVGYLDDGTMVVVEQAAHQVGNEVDAVVTSVLQSSAGRMIFCKQVFTPKGEKHSNYESAT